MAAEHEPGAPHPFAGRILFVTGRQGAGKTALANGLAAAHGLVHLDGDLWSGRAEIEESRASLCEYMVKYRGASSGSVADEPEAWKPFYAAMCAEAATMNAGSTTGVLVSHSLFRRAQRAFVKERLGDACLFLVLDPPPALALERAAKRCAEQYSAMGKSIKEWVGMLEMNSAGFQDYDPDDKEEVDALVLKNDGSERSVSELLCSAESLLGLGSSSVYEVT